MNHPVYYHIEIIFILLFTASVLYGQEPNYVNYTVDNGLPSSEVFHAIQDSKGYMWFGTDMGASRYDGYTFQNFGMKDGLVDNAVLEVFEDYKGRIWFVQFSINLSYYYKDSIYQYPFNDSLKQFFITPSAPSKLSFYVDSSDNIYLGIIRRGVIKIDSTGHVSKLFQTEPVVDWKVYVLNHKSIASARGLLKDSLIIYSDNLKKAHYFDYLGSNAEYALSWYNQNTGDLWFSCGEKLIHFNKNLELDTMLNIDENIVWLSADRSNNIWVGTFNGVLKIQRANEDLQIQRLLKSEKVSSVCQDKEGGYWITTLNNGIYYSPNIDITTMNMSDGLSDNNILELFMEDEKTFWLGYKNAMVQRVGEDRIEDYKMPMDRNQAINAIIGNREKGEVYVSAYSDIFIIKDGNISPIRNNNDYSFTCQDLYFANDILWISKYIGFQKYNIQNEELQEFFRGEIYRNYAIYPENDSSIWLGALSGLHKIENSKVINYGDTNPRLKMQINDIDPIGSNGLLISTKGAGLIFFYKDTIYNFLEEDGLSSNSVSSSFNMKDSICWIATNRGLTRILLDTINHQHKVDVYDIHDGLPTMQVNDVEATEKFVYAATIKGLTKFNYHQDYSNDVPPPVYVNDFWVNNDKIDISDHKILDYKDNLIKISFLGLSYKSFGEILYKYRMKGVDTAWVMTNSNTVQFTTLPPKKYTFEVYAQNEDGLWSTEPASVSFVIKRPFYQTWWFFIGMVFAVSYVIWELYKYRIREATKRKELIFTINDYKQKMLRQQMNPHFIFNTINSIQYYLLEEDINASLDYLSKFAKLMRLILENTQKTLISIKDELDLLKLYLELEQLRFEGRMTYKVEVDKKVNARDWKIPSLLLQPYCENAIKHGLSNNSGNGLVKVKVTFDSELKVVKFIVEDNGVGRQFTSQNAINKHKSFGSKITADRVTALNMLYNKDIKIEIVDLYHDNQKPAGTKVIITSPVIY